ncbi:MAG: glycosyltransferase family 2 protein [Propionibacteriaceae bacterium]|jgi:glycosyltransferase involved in cell wall biosynthesis|nr:glycosyltransferase family 2 protein [Propionibacteriaceae bacterium]
MSDTLYAVIPAYNEQATIGLVIDQWYPVVAATGPASRLVVLNDGSTDDTLALLRQAALSRPQLEVVDKPNSGHGGSVLAGYRHAVAAGADYIFQTDSDGQTDPAEFAAFWAARREADLVIGRRVHRQDGLSRLVVTRVLRLAVLALFRVHAVDANAPFRLMTRDSLARAIERIPDGYNLTNVAVTAWYLKHGRPVRWLPITFKPRQGGVNSINLRKISRIGRQAIADFARLNKTLA